MVWNLRRGWRGLWWVVLERLGINLDIHPPGDCSTVIDEWQQQFKVQFKGQKTRGFPMIDLRTPLYVALQ